MYMLIAQGEGGGGTLIFSYIGRLGSFFWGGGGGQNFEFQYFGGFQKDEYFLGYEDFVDGVNCSKI